MGRRRKIGAIILLVGAAMVAPAALWIVRGMIGEPKPVFIGPDDYGWVLSLFVGAIVGPILMLVGLALRLWPAEAGR